MTTNDDSNTDNHNNDENNRYLTDFGPTLPRTRKRAILNHCSSLNASNSLASEIITRLLDWLNHWWTHGSATNMDVHNARCFMWTMLSVLCVLLRWWYLYCSAWWCSSGCPACRVYPSWPWDRLFLRSLKQSILLYWLRASSRRKWLMHGTIAWY